jgi:hypothetical protein
MFQLVAYLSNKHVEKNKGKTDSLHILLKRCDDRIRLVLKHVTFQIITNKGCCLTELLTYVLQYCISASCFIDKPLYKFSSIVNATSFTIDP